MGADQGPPAEAGVERDWGRCRLRGWVLPLTMYRLRVVVRSVSPLIRLRLLVPADTTIAGLHAVLQIAFGWTGTHLHRSRRVRDLLAGDLGTHREYPVDPDEGGAARPRLAFSAHIRAFLGAQAGAVAVGVSGVVSRFAQPAGQGMCR